MTKNTPRADPPASLSVPARDWWRRLIRDFGIVDSAGLILLESTLQAWDRLQEAREALDRDGSILLGADGRPASHPAVRLERDSRVAVLAGFRALHLDVEPVGAVGRPPGSANRAHD